MRALQHAALLGVLAFTWIVGSPCVLTAQETSVAARPVLTPEQMETFLLKAKIVSMKGVSVGVTNSRQATLSDGQIRHDAHIQVIDVARVVFTPDRGPTELNFRDSFHYNIAGYRLALLLGLNNVPMSVQRSVNGHDAAVTWWVDDVLMDEAARKKKPTVAEWETARTNSQIHIMRVFDELIANTDRNAGNLLWTKDGTMWMIDHTRAFRLQEKLKNPALLQRCEVKLLEALRSLSADQMKRVMGNHLTKPEIESLLSRRDEIVKLFDDKIAKQGRQNVLYAFK